MSVLARIDPQIARGNRRVSVRRKLKLGSSTRSGIVVVVHDVSTTGLLIETTAELADGETLEVTLPEAGTMRARVVWNSGRFFGCRFATRISTAAVSASLLRSPAELPKALPLADDLPIPHGRDGAIDLVAEPAGLPFAVKLFFMVAASLALWALVFLAIGVL